MIRFFVVIKSFLLCVLLLSLITGDEHTHATLLGFNNLLSNTITSFAVVLLPHYFAFACFFAPCKSRWICTVLSENFIFISDYQTCAVNYSIIIMIPL